MKDKLCIFDLDGTLVNSLADLTWSVNQMLQVYNLAPYPEEEVQKMVGNGIQKLVERALCGRGKAQDYPVQAALKAFLEIYALHAADKTYPYPGMQQLLWTLRQNGFQTAVLSNKAGAMANSVVSALFDGGSFDLVRGLTSAAPPKPDPTAALQICKALHVAPERCFLVGDSGVDILTAQNGGFCSIGVTWGFRDRGELLQSGAQWIVDSPEQLQTVLLSF